jgi:5-methyltetrahydropteroyltriglutamate--homocysteine methyltransferase
MLTHTLGFPRMGRRRELKTAMEAYFTGKLDRQGLEQAGQELRRAHWTLQREAGIDLVPVGDFSFYDHMLDLTVLLGATPARYGAADPAADPALYYRLARGGQGSDGDVTAMEMTKWFDTNYHYIVPEFEPDQRFALSEARLGALLAQIDEARQAGLQPKLVLPGPFTFLFLGKSLSVDVDRFEHLDAVASAYGELLERLSGRCPWIQLDEPALCLDLPQDWAGCFQHVYTAFARCAQPSKVMLATYFGGVGHNASFIAGLELGAVHLDLVRAPQQLETLLPLIHPQTALSLGLVNGRNIWRVEAAPALALVKQAQNALGADRLLLAPSCSLLHVPLDLAEETRLDPEIKSWMAFAVQKCEELRRLADAAQGRYVGAWLPDNHEVWTNRRASAKTSDPLLRGKVAALGPEALERGLPYVERAKLQREKLRLPPLPTTTIGSFPQTPEIRTARSRFKKGELDPAAYDAFLREQIREVVRVQEELDLDALVHGEPERNDMVEYFGERLKGFCFTQNGWVQSYGARCVKPPIIYGDVSRPAPMTVEYARYAQSLTAKPMKGMLTGPVTILCWSFARDDQPRSETCRQIALAIREEAVDLEAAGLPLIQIDEPALREGLPLLRGDWDEYLRWAVDCFRLSASGVRPETQIHTHMCYSEFNEIVAWIAAMDADVISVEASRSRMELLDAFREFRYPNEIGPGVWDIHSPRAPSAQEMYELLRRAAEVIPADRLWVNPDCGLKTRAWPETLLSLRNMIKAARRMRAQLP